MRILIFANAFTAVTGGDKIFVEFGRHWLQAGEEVLIVTNEKGREFCLRHGFEDTHIEVWKCSRVDVLGVHVSSLYKTLVSLTKSLTTVHFLS